MGDTGSDRFGDAGVARNETARGQSSQGFVTLQKYLKEGVCDGINFQ